jgi:hypothetical protein
MPIDHHADDVIERERDEAPAAGQAIGERVAVVPDEQRRYEAGRQRVDQEGEQPWPGRGK